MKVLVIVNKSTDTFETCIPSPDLSSEELTHIYDLLGHGEHRTVHYVESGTSPLPFDDIIGIIKDFLKQNE